MSPKEMLCYRYTPPGGVGLIMALVTRVQIDYCQVLRVEIGQAEYDELKNRLLPPDPTDDPAVIGRLAGSAIARLDEPAGVRVLAVGPDGEERVYRAQRKSEEEE